MTELDTADLAVIAGRILGIDADAALARMEIPAAQAALAQARQPGREPDAAFPDAAAAAAAAVALVHALLWNRPFSQRNQPVAVAAGLQFLSLNGWRADLNPAATTVVVIEALASGRLAPGDAAAWLSARLSQASRAHRVRRAPAAGPRSRPGPPTPASPGSRARRPGGGEHAARGHRRWRRGPRGGLLTGTGYLRRRSAQRACRWRCQRACRCLCQRARRRGQGACRCRYQRARRRRGHGARPRGGHGARPAIPGGGVGTVRRPGLCRLYALAWPWGFPRPVGRRGGAHHRHRRHRPELRSVSVGPAHLPGDRPGGGHPDRSRSLSRSDRLTRPP